MSPVAHNSATHRRWDNLGVLLSSLCLVHCVVLPVLAVFFSFLETSYVSDERVHHLVTFLVVPVAFLALIPGYLRHRRAAIAGLGLFGVTFLIGAPFLHHASPEAEQMVSLAGSLALIAAHLWNRNCRCCHHR